MEVDNRLQCRISCGAEYVIENVLPSISNLSILCVLTSTSHDTMRMTVTADIVMMMMNELDNNGSNTYEGDDNNDDGWEE